MSVVINAKQVHNHAINKKIQRNRQSVSASVSPRQVGVAVCSGASLHAYKIKAHISNMFYNILTSNTLLHMYRIFFVMWVATFVDHPVDMCRWSMSELEVEATKSNFYFARKRSY